MRVIFLFQIFIINFILGESKFVLKNLIWLGFLAFFTILLIFGQVQLLFIHFLFGLLCLAQFRLVSLVNFGFEVVRMVLVLVLFLV